MSTNPPKLPDRVRHRIRVKGYSIRTEKAYADWIQQFIYLHDKRHPQHMGKPEIEAFLTYLAVNHNMAASTQSQAFNALIFLYKQVLEIELPDKGRDKIKKACAPGRPSSRAKRSGGGCSQ